MAEVTVSSPAPGEVYVDLLAGAGGEVRDTVALDELDDAARIAALGSLELDFDYYGRLVGIRVLGSAESALPPALLDATRATP